ncbi:MAG TPA: hypothetical protein PKZ76_11520 [Xanthomonadaceae bacterium]|nr:hypothetical protein [Xanthomonadaceae bacterium]
MALVLGMVAAFGAFASDGSKTERFREGMRDAVRLDMFIENGVFIAQRGKNVELSLDLETGLATVRAPDGLVVETSIEPTTDAVLAFLRQNEQAIIWLGSWDVYERFKTGDMDDTFVPASALCSAELNRLTIAIANASLACTGSNSSQEACEAAMSEVWGALWGLIACMEAELQQ